MTAAVTVRPLDETDRAAWQSLWDGYLRFYRVELAAEVTETAWRRLLDPAEDIHGLCAVGADGALVGIVHFLFHRVTWAIADRCYLEDLYVAGEARGGGVGRALIEAVYVRADARGSDQVYWLTQDFNETARRLYDRIGRKSDFIKYQR